VAMDADDLMKLLQSKLRSIGLLKGLGNAKRMARTAVKALAAGWGPHAVALRDACRRKTKFFVLDVLAHAARVRHAAHRAARALALGVAARALRLRNSARRVTLLRVLGGLPFSCRKRDFARRVTAAFAFGVFPMLLRAQGAPKGYVYGVKVAKKAAPKGPRVRGIHWDTLTDAKGTLWARRGAAKNPMLVMRELFPDLKTLFTEKERAKKGGGAGGEGGGEGGEGGEDAAKPKKPKEVAFLDATISRNLSISLSKFKNLPGFKDGEPPARFSVVREALTDMDETRLMGSEGVEILEKALWWKKEGADKSLLGDEDTKTALAGLTPDTIPLLAFAENFAYEMSRVPLLEHRVKCMRSKAGLAENMEMVVRDLAVFQGAAKEILKNDRLVELLVDVVRPFGNELNRASGKKDAPGIKIAGLLKLGATKTADNAMTSLFYIVSVLAQHRKHLLDVCHQFTDVKRASKLALKGLEDNFKIVKDTAALVQKGMAAARAANDAVFISAMGPFETSFGTQVGDLEKAIGKCKDDLARATEYLGEKGRDLSKPEDLCKEWTEFIALLSATYQEYREKVAKAEKKKKEEAAKAEAAAKKAEAAAKKAEAAAKKAEAAAAKEAAAAAKAAADAQAAAAVQAEAEALAAAEAMEAAAAAEEAAAAEASEEAGAPDGGDAGAPAGAWVDDGHGGEGWDPQATPVEDQGNADYGAWAGGDGQQQQQQEEGAEASGAWAGGEGQQQQQQQQQQEGAGADGVWPGEDGPQSAWVQDVQGAAAAAGHEAGLAEAQGGAPDSN